MADYQSLIPLNSKKPPVQLLVSLLLILPVSIVGMLISYLCGWLIFGIAPGDINLELADFTIKQINYLRLIQSFHHLSIFLIPSLFIAFFMSGNLHSYMNLRRRPAWDMALLSILFIVFIIPLNSYLAWLNSGMDLPQWLDGLEEWMLRKETQAETLTGVLINSSNPFMLMINLLVIALIPAVGEEFLYRGILQGIFTRWFKSGLLSVLIVALIFSATHIQFYGFLPRFILGSGFGLLYLWSGNIWLPVLAHMANNSIPVILSYLYGWGNINSTVDEFSSLDGLIVIIPTTIAIMILYFIRRRYYRGD